MATKTKTKQEVQFYLKEALDRICLVAKRSDGVENYILSIGEDGIRLYELSDHFGIATDSDGYVEVDYA